MDLLAGMSRDELRNLCVGRGRRLRLGGGRLASAQASLDFVGLVLLFAALNAGAGIYVLNHFGDSRWSPGSEPPLSAPSFSGTPVVGQFLGPLDSALNGVVGGVNDFLAFKHALPVALDFLGHVRLGAAGVVPAGRSRRRRQFRRGQAPRGGLRQIPCHRR